MGEMICRATGELCVFECRSSKECALDGPSGVIAARVARTIAEGVEDLLAKTKGQAGMPDRHRAAKKAIVKRVSEGLHPSGS